MADGSSGGIGGVLFEAGKAVGGAVKNQAQQTANAVGGQITGSAKPQPLFGGTKPAAGGFKPGGFGGQTGKADPFGGLGGDFGKMFEGGKPGFGAKKPPAPSTPQFTQAQLDDMAAKNSASDAQEIAKRQAELEQIKMQKHKQLHDEVYYEAIKNAGQHSIAQERKEKADAAQTGKAEEQQRGDKNQLPELPQNMTGNSPHLGTPVAVTQAKTQTEANRGTTG